jgi:hypothetical protein
MRSWKCFLVTGAAGTQLLACSTSLASALWGNQLEVKLGGGGSIGICWSITSRESLMVHALYDSYSDGHELSKVIQRA